MNTTQTSIATGTSVSERLVAVLADTWRAIQARHPEVPDVAIVFGTDNGGRRRTSTRKLGHFASRRWVKVAAAGQDVGDEGQAQPEQFVHELLIGGDALVLSPVELLGVELHEAVHALADARGIADTSVRGTYHNGKFRALAVELGLDVAEDGTRGWSATSVPAATAALYAAQVQALAHEVTVHRVPEPARPPGSAPVGRMLAAVCECVPEVRFRISRAQFERTTIRCDTCGQPFTLEE